MRRIGTLLCCFLLVVAAPSYAAKKSSMLRGGLGFLFADSNSFENPGAFSMLRGASFEAGGEKDKERRTDAATTSLVMGSGRVGGGVFFTRTGLEGQLDEKNLSADVVGGALGVNFARNRVSVGAEYSRVIDGNASSDGVASVSLTLHPNGKGFSAGMGASTTFNADTEIRTARLGLGWAFTPDVMFESLAKWNDLQDNDDYSLGGFFTVSTNVVYVGTGYYFHNSSRTHEALARLGVVIASAVDLSALASKVLIANSDPTYGASVRVKF